MKRYVTIIGCLLIGFWCQVYGTDLPAVDGLTVDTTLAVADRQPVDTLDDYVQPRQRSFNALRYSLDDYHHYSGDNMERGLSMLDIGGGLMTTNDNNLNNQPLTLLHLRYGRQINPFSTLRIGVDGGFGIIGRFSGGLYNTVNGHVALGADYLYSLTTHLMGYRPERKLDVSAMIGVTAGYSKRFNSLTEMLDHQLRDHHLSARLRTGVQMKFFASPQSAIAVEPYLFLSSRAYDLIQPSYEYYHYRMGAGVDVSYVYYLRNRLTPEGSEGTFMRRFSRGQRYLAGDISDALRRHPIVVGLMSGAAGIDGHGREYNQSYGPGVTASLGWWLSPALGMRGSVGSDNIDWDKMTSRISKSIYRHAGFDLMLNPFGFSRNSDWRSSVGVTLLAGYEAGLFRQTANPEIPAFGYHAAISLWARLTDNLRLTVEPGYTHLTNRGEGSSPVTDRYSRLDVGLEMVIDGESQPYEKRQSTNFPLGYFVGVGGGWNFTYRYGRESNYEEWLKNTLFMAGYEYSHLHGIRLAAEYVNDHFRNGIRKEWQERWLVSADYRLSLNTLLWGANPGRHWNAQLNIGPAVAFGGKQPKAGANAGLELDYRLGKHFSLFAAHNAYYVPKKLNATEQTAKSNITSTYNIGLIYHFENLIEPMLQVSGADTISHRWTVGIGSGFHYSSRTNRLPGGTRNSNAMVSVKCQLTPIVALCLDAEYMSYNYAGKRIYKVTSGDSRGLQFSDMSVTTSQLLNTSLAVEYDFVRLLFKNRYRRWSLCGLAGMAGTSYLGESATIPAERADYEVMEEGTTSSFTPCVLLGSSIDYRLTEHVSVGVTHHYYWYGMTRPQWLYNIAGPRTSPGHFNSFNLTMKYTL